MSSFSMFSVIGILLGLAHIVLWLVVAVAAFMAYLRGRQSAVVLQAVGAVGICCVTLAQTVVIQVLSSSISSWGPNGIQLYYMVLWVLGFFALLLFAVGYCMEKFSQRSNIMPPASPVSDVGAARSISIR